MLTNLSVGSGGLRPLARCKALRILALSNQFDTEDYAYLSVALPDARCRQFQSWTRVSHLNEIDTMITGKRKPFLNSSTDAARIAAYEESFRELQARFAAEIRSGRR